jgi:hypothetical protein
MATSPTAEKCRRVTATSLRLCAISALFAAGAVSAQGLEKFQPKESPQERLVINSAIQQCVRMIQQKTVQARVSIKGPCRKESGEWSGVDKSDAGFKLRFSVTPAESSAGTLISALQGDAVRVFCTADAQGAVTQFEDVKEGIRESFSSTGLCWPAGD